MNRKTLLLMTLLFFLTPMLAANDWSALRSVRLPASSDNGTPSSLETVISDPLASDHRQTPVSPKDNDPDASANIDPDSLPDLQTLAQQDITVLHSETGQTLVFDALTYTAGAIAAEMPPTFHAEALKAQGVAAHTYALCRNLQIGSAPLTAHPEAWEGVVTEELFMDRYGDEGAEYWDKIMSAAQEVFHRILLHDDQPIVAAYHSMSAGMTEDAANVWMGSAPYLIPVDSPGDKDAPGFASEVIIDRDQMAFILENALPGLTLQDDPRDWLSVLERTPSGYVSTVLAGDSGQTLTGLELRNLCSLRSSAFTISYDNETGFTFHVEGYGHGVGLSQYGAQSMAESGSSYTDILAHYFPNTVLTTA